MSGLQALTVIVMAKAPRPGHAKTRLIPALGPEDAAQLARQLLDRTLAIAQEAGIGQVQVCATPPTDSEAWQGMAWPPGLDFSAQGEGDLGERMARASKRALTSNHGVILLGTDCVDLSADLLRRAAGQLESADGVIYPTHDGGYALLGLRRFSPLLFQGIPWSTDSVYKLTLERFAHLGWTLARGETLQDIDEPGDLHHLSGLTESLNSR